MTHAPDTCQMLEADAAETCRPCFAPPTATPPEVKWRHASWEIRRHKLRAALALVVQRRGRLDRWDNCGACAAVEYSPIRKRHRVTCWHCRDRFCQPCQTAKRCELVRIVNAEPAQVRHRMLTFTLRHDNAGLRQKIALLRRSFRRLIKTKWWKARAIGGVAVLEIKLSADKRWHPHLHVVADAEYMPQRELADAWRKASGGSFIVDIREVKNPAHAAGYIAKYLTKGVDADVLNSQPHLIEAIAALRGQRSFDVWGSWRGNRTTQAADAAAADPDEHAAADHLPNDWTPVATLREWLAACHAKQPWAEAIRLSLLAHNANSQAPPG